MVLFLFSGEECYGKVPSVAPVSARGATAPNAEARSRSQEADESGNGRARVEDDAMMLIVTM